MTSDVDYEELVRIARRLCDGFSSLHEEVRALIEDEEGPLVYTVMTLLARRLITDFEAGNTSHFADFFNTVEEILRVATYDVRNLLISGLLEDLQNLAEQAGVARTEWERWLGPSSLVGWHAVADSWEGRMTAEQYNAVLAGKSTPRSLLSRLRVAFSRDR
jgi:hypothetical protein